MNDSITFYAENVEDISPVSQDSVEVTLQGVDVSQLVAEIGTVELLDEIGMDEVVEWLENQGDSEDE